MDHSDAKRKSALCAKLLENPDASSSELERAGDAVRKVGRRGLALSLCERAITEDPENYSAQIELLCFRAETTYENRNEDLQNAKKISLEQIKADTFKRVFNAFIELSRCSELADFSDEILAKVDEKNDSIRLLALRNKAVCLKQLGQLSASSKTYESAFEIDPNDENTLKSYLGFLEETGESEEYARVANKLLEIDPTDSNYYVIGLNMLINNGKWVQARELMSQLEIFGEDIDPQGLFVIGRLQRKLELQERLLKSADANGEGGSRKEKSSDL